jgi:hypothetical protein
MPHLTRIMYVENKSAQPAGQKGVCGPARIGRVVFSKSLQTVYYMGRTLQRTKGGYKYNHLDVETGDEYWISGPKRNGADGLYGPRPTRIDEDVREEYWTLIRKQPTKKHLKATC